MELGHALLLFSRGAPAIYYGDEQGMIGLKGDQDARQTMFESRVPTYQSEQRLRASTPGAPGFDETAPLYRAIAGMAAIRNAHAGLRRGEQVVRVAGERPGLYVFTRTDPEDGQYVIALNTSLTAQAGNVTIDTVYGRWTGLHGACPSQSAAPGVLSVTRASARLGGLPRRGRAMSDADLPEPARDWRHGATIYQIYPRSFADSNGDGVGDLPGITARLEHVASPGRGRDLAVALLRLADEGLRLRHRRPVRRRSRVRHAGRLRRPRGRGARRSELKVIVDQVYCHLSDRSAWFEESRQSKDNPKADWFVWADAKPDGSPPSNWQSVFHGPSWRWDARRQQYHLHNFLPEQPDLNVHHPQVQEALLEVARFWLDRGVDGFRLDAINFAMHDPQLRDNPPAPPERPGRGRSTSRTTTSTSRTPTSRSSWNGCRRSWTRSPAASPWPRSAVKTPWPRCANTPRGPGG